MTPEKWARMSWHARLRYIRDLGRREADVRRQEKALSKKRCRLKQPPATVIPGYDPDAVIREAKALAATITPDSPQVIKDRQQLLNRL